MSEFLRVVCWNALVLNLWVIGCGVALLTAFAALTGHFQIAAMGAPVALLFLFTSRALSRRCVPERAQIIL